ncbi:tetracycline resistance MFS efflux pump [Rhodobacterales bacterium 52_120_T64]|nr:tetracycline resistance MFS efflux pump [Rhodobacterales bacterium 52_120_T64]
MKARLPFVFIIITMMLNSIGIGLILPVMPDLITDLTGGSISSAALWGGILATTYAVMQFFTGPTLGNLSDRFGRRPILLISLIAMGLDYILLSLAGTIWWLFAGRVIAGVAGATFSTASAYIADISTPEKRAANFGLIGAAFGIGFIIGPAIGGFLGEIGPRVPFMTAAVVALANATLGYFILPETLVQSKRRAFDWTRANPLGALLSIRKIPHLASLVTVFLVFTISHQVYPSVWSYYTIERFDFSPKMIGASLGTFGFFIAVVQGGMIRVIIPKLGEMRTAMWGMGLNFFVFLLVAFLGEVWMLFALMPLMALGAVAGPALQGIMSKWVDDDAQGELQGIFASVTGIALILSPITMTSIFKYFTSSDAPYYLPGAPFVASSLLEISAMVMLFVIAKRIWGNAAVPAE